nr:MAG: replication associated protein [Cressdnaviricota sp.]
MSYYWMFTAFESKLKKVPEVMFVDQYKYLVYQLEKCPDTGRYHYQGYVAFLAKKRLTTLKKFDPTIHWEMRRGTHKEAFDYCTKEDTRIDGPWTYGDDKGIPQKKGERSDVKNAVEILIDGGDLIKEGYGDVIVKYPGGISYLRNELQNRKKKEELEETFSLFKPMPWQEKALDLLNKQNDRQILWVVDECGNTGKTYLATYLMVIHNAFYAQVSKKDDVFYAYDYQSIVVFDYTRADREYANYSVIESMKNGVFFSPKYQSITKVNTGVKVIVFSNWQPNKEMLSKDRWQIMDLSDYNVELPSKVLTELYCDE